MGSGIRCCRVMDKPRPSRRRSIRVDPDLYAGLDAFRQVAALVISEGEHLEMDTVVGLALQRGLDALLSDLIARTGQETLLKTIQQLAQQNPALVYRFIADRMRAGDLEYSSFIEDWKRFLSSNGK